MIDRRQSYSSNVSEETAADFNGTFSSFAKWQSYASDFAGSFASAVNNDGWFQKVKNIFSNESKQNKKYWENRIKK